MLEQELTTVQEMWSMRTRAPTAAVPPVPALALAAAPAPHTPPILETKEKPIEPVEVFDAFCNSEIDPTARSDLTGAEIAEWIGQKFGLITKEEVPNIIQIWVNRGWLVCSEGTYHVSDQVKKMRKKQKQTPPAANTKLTRKSGSAMHPPIHTDPASLPAPPQLIVSQPQPKPPMSPKVPSAQTNSKESHFTNEELSFLMYYFKNVSSAPTPKEIESI